MSLTERPYPKPGKTGGKLIRELISALRDSKRIGLDLPLSDGSHILIAASGGLDSVALAVLVARYGRRVGDPKQITLVHVNHGWRGAESDGDEEFVRALAERLGVKFRVFRLKPPAVGTGDSLEDLARAERKQIYAKLTRGGRNWLLTAHHADDLAETLLWRLFTGAAGTHGGGIVARDGAELRPLLRVRKQELEAFLREEGESWREDRTNHEGRFLRSRMRRELMPAVEKLFPRAVEHLVRQGLESQCEGSRASPSGDNWSRIFGVLGIRARRAHHEAIQKSAREVHLPAGWKLVRSRKRTKSKNKTASRAGS